MSTGATVLSFFRPVRKESDWNQKELAEFYRVEAGLVQAGMAVWTDRGLSDEGDPWFVFGRCDNEEVIAHFARFDGKYIIVSSVFPTAASGNDFNALVRELLSAHPYVAAKNATANRQQNVYLHPAAMLAALLATAFAKTAELGGNSNSDPNGDTRDHWSFLHRFELAIISAIALVVATTEKASNTPLDLLTSSAGLDLDSVALSDQATVGEPGDIEQGADAWTAKHQFLEAAAYSEQPVSLAINNDLSDDPSTPAAIESSNRSDFSLPLDGSALSELSVSYTREQYRDHTWNLVDSGLITIPGTELRSQTDTVDTVGKPAGTTEKAQASVNHFDTNVADSIEVVLTAINGGTIAQLPATTFEKALQESLASVGYNSGIHSIELVEFRNTGSSAEVHGSIDTGVVVASAEDLMRPILEAFIQRTPNIRVAVFGDDVVMVDADTSHMSSNYELVTWNLDDGSSLTIVGIIPPDMTHHT